MDLLDYNIYDGFFLVKSIMSEADAWAVLDQLSPGCTFRVTNQNGDDRPEFSQMTR
jgi:hypothetical protein